MVERYEVEALKLNGVKVPCKLAWISKHYYSNYAIPPVWEFSAESLDTVDVDLTKPLKLEALCEHGLRTEGMLYIMSYDVKDGTEYTERVIGKFASITFYPEHPLEWVEVSVELKL